MLFNSLEYAVFLPCVFLLYWLLPHKLRWPLLLTASYYFYMSWNAKYVVLIATTTLVSYACARWIEKAEDKKRKKAAVALALGVSLGILYLFKYFNFSLDLLERLSPHRFARLHYLLPVGISFYTFQTLSYVLDVYRGEVKAEKNLGVYATFVSFFPQLVAGPIERTKNLMPQITAPKRFDYGAATYGVRLILWGLYKKMVIADNLAVYADRVFGNVQGYSGCGLFLVSLFFSLQIYCDFSGYSDIARGSAKLLNIELMENFKSPYFSASIREFWSRWHISLSTWFRDYVYIPLGGNRVSKPRNILNNLITFLVSGLWHGANLTFLFWGGLHGAGQVYENALGVQKTEKRDIYWLLRVPCVFLFVTLAWVFFRAASLHDAAYVLRHMLDGLSLRHPGAYLSGGLRALAMDRARSLRTLLLYILPLGVYDFFSLKTDVCAWLGRRGPVVRCAYVLAIVSLILLFGYVGRSTFVYFQF